MTKCTYQADSGKRAETRCEPISVRIPEACRLTGIGRSKLYELIANGDIGVVKVGTMTLVPFEGLREFIRQAQGKGGPRAPESDLRR